MQLSKFKQAFFLFFLNVTFILGCIGLCPQMCVCVFILCTQSGFVKLLVRVIMLTITWTLRRVCVSACVCEDFGVSR